jgi:hypothetical protein
MEKKRLTENGLRPVCDPFHEGVDDDEGQGGGSETDAEVEGSMC